MFECIITVLKFNTYFPNVKLVFNHKKRANVDM
jgi:hypothetical protein